MELLFIVIDSEFCGCELEAEEGEEEEKIGGFPSDVLRDKDESDVA